MNLLRSLLPCCVFLFGVLLVTSYDIKDEKLVDSVREVLATDLSAENIVTLDDAIAKLSHAHDLLKRVFEKSNQYYDVYINDDGEVELPKFLKDERAAESENPTSSPSNFLEDSGEQKSPESINCANYLNCNLCRANGCGWCIAGRRCIEDIAWVCRGDHDHVGKVGKHSTCPSEEDNRDAHKWRKLLKSGSVENDKLPAGTYKDSCTECLYDKETLLLHCAGCMGSNGASRPSQLDVSSCAGGSGIGNSDGALVCNQKAGSMEIEEAKLRAKARLETRQLEELERVKQESVEEDTESKSKLSEEEAKERAKRAQEIEQRAKIASESGTLGKCHGASFPYETLGVSSGATSKEIRKAYRHLTLRLHPDKNPASLREAALAAFRDIVAAYEVIGNPDKRAAFDDYGSTDKDDGGFNTFWEYEQSGEKDTRDFYSHHPLITQLNEKLWDRRIRGESIWLVEFYAPWCSHCRSLVPKWKQLAEELKLDSIEIGAVNCEKSSTVCSEWFDIPSYPTIMILNNEFGTQQIYHGNKDVAGISEWARQVEKEWRYLFANSNLVRLNHSNFQRTVLNTTEFWVVCFLDGLDCSSCKTASTNMLRLGAALNGMARIGIVDCSEESEHDFCYSNQEIPRAPHPAIVKVWGKGEKHDTELSNKGETLYNSNELEPHLALQITEKAVRLSLASDMIGSGSLTNGDAGEFDKDEKKEESPPSPPPPPPMWNGPKRAAPLPWDGSGGGGRSRGRIAGRL